MWHGRRCESFWVYIWNLSKSDQEKKHVELSQINKFYVLYSSNKRVLVYYRLLTRVLEIQNWLVKIDMTGKGGSRGAETDKGTS